jgi:uncharacterized membrane protein YqaE (UPF0057 family)
MRRLLCFICPPLAAFLWGSFSQAVVNVLLCCLLFIPGVLHALGVVREFELRLDWELRNRRTIEVWRKSDTSICGLSSS